MTFLSELRRRNVIRMAGLYLVGAWLLVQLAGTVLPMFGAPAWLPRSIVEEASALRARILAQPGVRAKDP